MQSGLREWIVVYLKGVSMGIADAIPGVSGGTIALITGIYERLVTAIAALDPRVLSRLAGIGDPAERAAFVEDLRRMDLGFLIVLGLGIVTAVVAVSHTLSILIERYRAPMNAFFLGLIGASAVVLYGEVRIDTPRRWLAAAAGFAGAFVLTGATASGGLPHGPLVVFLTGIVTSSAMLLPGISGAALLYVLGQYEYMIDALREVTGAVSGVVGGGPAAALLGPGTVVATFLAGVAVGVLTIARVVRWALDAYRAATLVLLVSLMAGSLRLPVEEIMAATSRWTPTGAAAVVLAALGGAGAVLALDRYTDDLEF